MYPYHHNGRLTYITCKTSNELSKITIYDSQLIKILQICIDTYVTDVHGCEDIFTISTGNWTYVYKLVDNTIYNWKDNRRRWKEDVSLRTSS